MRQRCMEADKQSTSPKGQRYDFQKTDESGLEKLQTLQKLIEAGMYSLMYTHILLCSIFQPI